MSENDNCVACDRIDDCKCTYVHPLLFKGLVIVATIIGLSLVYAVILNVTMI